MNITLENYEEIKQQLTEFEAREKRKLEAIEKEKKIKQMKREFLESLPRNQGLLCYVTKVKIEIDCRETTYNYQGETEEHKVVEMPTEIYDEIFFKKNNDIE